MFCPKTKGNFAIISRKSYTNIVNIAINPRKNTDSLLLIHYKKKQGRTL